MSLTTKDNWIYQSNKLIEASYTLTTMEQKLIRLLASMIKREDQNFKEYQLEAQALARILNIHPKTIYREIENVSTSLMKRIIKIKEKEKEKFSIYHFVEYASYDSGTLNIKISPDMKDFYLHLEQYTKYQLKYVLQFKLQHSFKLYELLKQYEKLKERSITINELKFTLAIEKQYPNYSNFKQKVLLRCQSEINEKSDLIFDFEEIKKNRKVSAIKIKITPKLNIMNVKEDVSSEKYFFEEIKSEFKKLYKGELADKFIQKMVETKSIEHIQKCLYDYKDYIQGRNIGNISGDFYTFVTQGYTKPTNFNGNKPAYADFKQREYSEEYYEQFYANKD